MAMRKVQLYLTEEQYVLLRQRAGQRGSIAQAVRDLIDASIYPDEPTSDPFFEHIVAKRRGSGKPYSAERGKRDLYKRPR